MMGKFAQQVYTFEGAGIVTRVGAGVRSVNLGQSVFFLREAKMETVVRVPEDLCCAFDHSKFSYEVSATFFLCLSD
jgi:NADPH:quinone reductase-like Zn-dependent oxidoreductase